MAGLSSMLTIQKYAVNYNGLASGGHNYY